MKAMSKNHSSQTQNDKNAANVAAEVEKSSDNAETRSWDPTLPLRLGFTMWTRLASDQVERMQSFYDEVAELESRGYERARRTGREFATMFEQNVGYLASMSAEFQALSLESVRKSREFLASK